MWPASTNVPAHCGHYTNHRPTSLVHPALWMKEETLRKEKESADSMKDENKACVFCRIAANIESAAVLYRDDKFLAIRDHRPAAPHHYLVLPICHMDDAKHLTRKDIPTVEKMAAIGKQVLEDQGAPVNDVRFGFHWPPFQAIRHLHLHCVGPVSEMGYFNKKVAFRPDSWCFVTVEWLLDHLQE
eukprot:GGOE01004338.1.p1 GENE.GGOE01004338.1~~GGOE01004338.1.p1  ORF type:complete len:185 (-),score=29.68 GGOE01004338.1:448-1002(-)